MKTLLSFCFVAALFPGMSQTMSCAVAIDGNGDYTFNRINLTTGMVTFSEPLPIETIHMGSSVLNPLTDEYVFRGSVPGNTDINYFTVDIHTGTVVNEIVETAEVLWLELHPTTGITYGVTLMGPSHHFVSVNTTTAVITDIADLGDITSFGEAVIDPVANHYIFSGSYGADPFTIRNFVVDLATGAVLSDAATTGNFINPRTDEGSGTVYGIRADGPDAIFASLDPATGIITDYDTLPDVVGVEYLAAVLNPDAGHYIIKGSTTTTERYLTVDMTDGSIVNDVAALAGVYELQYYAADFITVSTAPELNSVDVFPNPAQSIVTVVFGQPVSNASLTLYNPAGAVVRSIDPINGASYILGRGDLPAGIYYLSVAADGEVPFNGKVVFVD